MPVPDGVAREQRVDACGRRGHRPNLPTGPHRDPGLQVHLLRATRVGACPHPRRPPARWPSSPWAAPATTWTPRSWPGRLAAGGWTLVDDAAEADVAVVNTCGFVEQAKKDSIDSLIEASSLKESGRTQKVVAVGCLAERYGQTLADELPEADAVLGFDTYADMSTHLRTILDGGTVPSHVPSDRRKLLPLSPATRQSASADVALPGPRRAAGPARHRTLGPAEDRQRLRPAVRLLRHPDVPRVLRLAPPHRRHRRGALARHPGRA